MMVLGMLAMLVLVCPFSIIVTTDLPSVPFTATQRMLSTADFKLEYPVIIRVIFNRLSVAS